MSDNRTCTCHPDDNPPRPCPRKYALHECRDAELARLRADNARLREELDGVIKELADAREEHRRHVHNLLARMKP